MVVPAPAMLLLCFSGLLLAALPLAAAAETGVPDGVPAFNDPCKYKGKAKDYKTSIASLQGVWSGTCRQMNSDNATCLSKPRVHDSIIAFNGTTVGVNISGAVYGLGAFSIVASTPLGAARDLLIHFPTSATTYLEGSVLVSITCENGVPTYHEASVHRLNDPNGFTSFPFVQQRDLASSWCNESPKEDKHGHAAASFNIICKSTRVRDIGAGWP